jgi:hypothetical protein
MPGRRVYHVTGHNPCLCQALYTYVHFSCFLNNFVLISFTFFFCILNTQCLCTRQACQPGFCSADYPYCSYTAQGYDHSPDIWTVVFPSATKFSVMSFALVQHEVFSVRYMTVQNVSTVVITPLFIKWIIHEWMQASVGDRRQNSTTTLIYRNKITRRKRKSCLYF